MNRFEIRRRGIHFNFNSSFFTHSFYAKIHWIHRITLLYFTLLFSQSGDIFHKTVLFARRIRFRGYFIRSFFRLIF